MIAVSQGRHPVCIAAAWTNALLAVNPAQSFPDGLDAFRWTLAAHDATIPGRTTPQGGRVAISLGSVARVFRDAGLIADYRALHGVDEVLEALFDGPVIASLDWTDGMEHPDPATGIVRPIGRRTPRHSAALLDRRTCRHSTTHPNGDFVRLRNSRGLTYGDQGDALLRVDDLARTLHRAMAFR